MEGMRVIPRIVHNLSAALIVGSHHEVVFLCKLHHPFCLLSIRFAIRMCTTVRVCVVTVHIDTIGVVTCSAVDGVVAAMVSSIRVGVRTNVEVNIIKDVGALRKCRILEEIVDPAEHQHPTCCLIAVDSRGVQELRFTRAASVVDVSDQKLTVAWQSAEVDDFTHIRVVSRKLEHHVFVCGVGRILIPVVSGAVITVPHHGVIQHRRRSLQCHLVSHFLEFGELLVVGVSCNDVSIDAVHRDGVCDSRKVVIAVEFKSKIVLIALLHELVEVFFLCE